MHSTILASSSPRRRELLTLVGIAHRVRPADIDETILPGETPEVHALRLACEKAEVVAREHRSELVIAADTIVVLDGEILGKPKSDDEARQMLGRLSGRTHTVVTGMACSLEGRTSSGVEKVSVTFRDLTEAEIIDYVETREPMDKAGAYGIQGYGATIVRRIDGDFFAVMGLSLVRLTGLMSEVGVTYDFPR
ncbi:MAG TPA: Maf family protein [Gemmatimonadaceae bacterium]|nr:Maf family protein [Gemmatimonadaceae bacterium]